MDRSTTNTSAMMAAIATILLLASTQPASALMSTGVIGSQVGGTGTTTRPPVTPPRPPETVPTAPILYARWKTPSVVMLDYIDVSLVETGFTLQRRRAGDPAWQAVASFGPSAGKFGTGSYRVSGLEPTTDYCFRLVAYNAQGNSAPNDVCVRTTYAGACEEAKLEEVLAQATDDASEVEIDCDLYLEPGKFVFKRLVFTGSLASNLTVDLNGSTLSGLDGTVNEGHDMIEVRSREVPPAADVVNAISTYERPSNITIRNGTVYGSVRLVGMARNGEGDGDKTIQCTGNTCYEVDILATNQLKKSSRLPDHTARAQRNAPTGIVLERLTIYGTGRSPVYFAPGVTNSKLVDSHVLGYSNAVAIYLDAESAGNTFKGNVIDVATKDYPFEGWDRPLVAIDGSAHNKFINNWFSNLSHGGIYFYRNCGENGVIRHQTPSNNELINNIFYYNEYDGDNQSVLLGARNRGGWFQDTFGFCEHDAGYPYGSSANDEDYARYNAIMQNQIYKRSIADMIQTKNLTLNSPNYNVGNVTVTDATVDLTRPAGCYNGNAGFVKHGDKIRTTTKDSRGCSGTDYLCSNGESVAQPFDRCVSIPGGSTAPLTATRR